MQKMQLEATYITLASNVVAAAIQEASLRAQIEAQLKIVSMNRHAMEIVHNQLKLGYISEMDVTAQELTSALAQQALVPLQQQLEQTRNLLRVLAGNTPDEDIEEKFTLEALQLPQKLPLSLPSKLVEQRPDVRIAEAQLHYASAQYGVAIANTMPQFAVTGGMAASPAWMFKNGGYFFDLTSNATQTIFDGGTLRAKSRTAQQGLDQAAAQYRSVVMDALQNVADSLYVIQSDARSLKAAATTARASGKIGELTRKQYEAGAVDFQTFLVAQQNEQLAVINLIRAQTNRLGNTAALFQALGGGWGKR
jgi:NodT family efflux transporter outer membrane factor (OMF) lipoprotein